MSDCAGCDAYGKIPHTPECLFDHFLSYTGYAQQPESVIEMLRKAYYDGMEVTE